MNYNNLPDYMKNNGLFCLGKVVTIRYTLCNLKGGLAMDEIVINTTTKQIGDTLYIVDSAISSNTKETTYEKLKRMILNDTNTLLENMAS